MTESRFVHFISSRRNERNRFALASGTKPAASGAALTAVTKADSSGSGPHPNWHGTWQGATPATRMVITATRVGACKWVNSTDPTFDGECNAGYKGASVPLADILSKFEESVLRYQCDPKNNSISDPTQFRS